ncbi:ATP-binding cassette domain-containing protein [Paenibacillus arenilitoris]|uniref:Nickel import system ATP-binding protein NikD n=1 Tax=Paenibacillus arenilitoris TaxID=2772299 RepID=A0A927CHT1_9BACL|nr:ABC transporter ATP-binding protein [Paenibacillus arenilitoris]MBD2867297.1 ABC transporter ATP-binding protein [Paenibacillus arenilitoris]
MGQRIPLLEVKDFTLQFKQYGRGLKQIETRVISGFTLDVHAGEIVAVVGASGSGKSLLAHAILGILPSNAATGGSLKFKGEELSQSLKERLRGKEISLIPQSVSYLDPLMTTGKQIESPLRKAANAVKSVMNRFQLGDDAKNKYPFQLSGGMARRVLIGTALTSGAELVIADEPTPGLHKSMVDETLGSLKELAALGRGVLMITHDIDLAFVVADRIAVFNKGLTVEVADAKAFEASPDNVKHPYSKALWHALPQNGFHSVRGKDYGEEIDAGCDAGEEDDA